MKTCVYLSYDLTESHITREVSDKNCTEIKTQHFMFHNFFPENRDVYEITWENTVQPDRPQLTQYAARALLFFLN